MIRLGITRPEQFRKGLDLMGRVSYQLLRTSSPATPAEIERFEAIVRDLQLSSGVFRTTFPGRLAELDAVVNPILAGRFGGRRIEVEDWAASDCVTSAEWARSLRPLFPELRFTASDLVTELTEARLPSGEVFILEPDGAPIQYIRPPLVVHLRTAPSWRFAVNRIARDRALRRWKGGGEAVRTQIPLAHPDAIELARTSDYFFVRRHSVFDPLEAPCDTIRTMNIFNPGYFGAADLRRGVNAAALSLREGGVWIVGRTELGGEHGATIFERSGDGFRVIERVGQGWELEKEIV